MRSVGKLGISIAGSYDRLNPRCSCLSNLNLDPAADPDRLCRADRRSAAFTFETCRTGINVISVEQNVCHIHLVIIGSEFYRCGSRGERLFLNRLSYLL